MERQRAIVVGSTDLSPTVRHLRLRMDTPLRYEAGQWVDLHVQLPGGGEEKRAYSIANMPDSDGASAQLDIIVTKVPDGRVSPALHGLPVGGELAVTGPHGYFVRDGSRASQPLLLVGTGSGLAPLRAIAQDVLAHTARPLTLLFGCRTRQDILFRGELEAWAGDSGRFALHVTLSRGERDWSGRRGYVQEHVVDVVGDSRPEVFICGLSPMVKAVRSVLKQQLGYDRKQIHSERYD